MLQQNISTAHVVITADCTYNHRGMGPDRLFTSETVVLALIGTLLGPAPRSGPVASLPPFETDARGLSAKWGEVQAGVRCNKEKRSK